MRYAQNMTADLVTVYRSADSDAQQDAAAVKNLLIQSGLGAVLCDDNTPGVEPGCYEVRVPEDEAAQAEDLVATAYREDSSEVLDPSHELDMIAVFESQGATGEMEAMAVQSILDANGINAILIGSSSMPNLSFHVRIAQGDVEQAQRVLEEARAAGPAAAIEAERESERYPIPPEV